MYCITDSVPQHEQDEAEPRRPMTRAIARAIIEAFEEGRGMSAERYARAFEFLSRWVEYQEERAVDYFKPALPGDLTDQEGRLLTRIMRPAVARDTYASWHQEREMTDNEIVPEVPSDTLYAYEREWAIRHPSEAIPR